MKVRFSITVRQHAQLRRLNEAIPETDWRPIPSSLHFDQYFRQGLLEVVCGAAKCFTHTGSTG